MERIQLSTPEKFIFSTEIHIRITDMNYGGHLGNDTLLSIIHEARLQFYQSLGYSEMDIEGFSTIMSDCGIQYKTEVFQGDVITILVNVASYSRVGFDIHYKAINQNDKVVAKVKTGIVMYDYKNQKVASVPKEFKEIIKQANERN